MDNKGRSEIIDERNLIRKIVIEKVVTKVKKIRKGQTIQKKKKDNNNNL